MDTSFREHLNLNGAGICLQDHQGNIMAIRTNFRHPCLKVAEGEAWALEEAMVFQNVTFETDIEVTVNKDQ